MYDQRFLSFFKGKRVLVTGHTGFKGAWLSQWLVELGASVVGYSLEPETQPNLFDALGLEGRMTSVFGDVRDLENLWHVVQHEEPDVIFHLAAQPLVRRSYRDPVETYSTNVLGTVNVLEAARRRDRRCAVVAVTTDKVYQNQEWPWGYRENDRLGGHDPYSSSKACAELVTSAYRSSFFQEGPVWVATTRAGNVIGGGDWSEDRLVPDIIRSIAAGDPVRLRNPGATRPWQHVLEPLRGYMMLAERLWSADGQFAESWNFGPRSQLHVPVGELAQECIRVWGKGRAIVEGQANQPHETNFLALDSTLAHSRLHWQPVLDFHQTIELTVEWYKQYSLRPALACEVTTAQLAQYVEQVRVASAPAAPSAQRSAA